MAEALRVTEAAAGPTSVNIAIDEVVINGVPVKIQRIKLALGADGVYQLDLAAGQAGMALSIPVAIASDQSAIPISLSGQQLSANQGNASGSQKWLFTLPDPLPFGTNLLGGIGLDLQRGVVSAVTSITQQFVAGGFVATAGESALGMAAIGIVCVADVDSAVNGLVVDQSTNGAIWDISDVFTVIGGTPFVTTIGLVGQFYRLRYTNGAVDQSAVMRLQVVKRPIAFPLPRTLTPQGRLRTDGHVTASYTDRSGVIAVGGTAQQVMALKALRIYAQFQNVSDTDMWIDVRGATAVPGRPSYKISPGGAWESPLACPPDAISVYCATTGKEYTADEV